MLKSTLIAAALAAVALAPAQWTYTPLSESGSILTDVTPDG